MESQRVKSLYRKSFRTIQGATWTIGHFLESPEAMNEIHIHSMNIILAKNHSMNIILAENLRWEPFEGQRTVTGQITVMIAAQPHVFEYRDGKVPPGEARRLSWESRMNRLASEVRWEGTSRASNPNTRTDNHRRVARDVADRGYEMGLDMVQGFVFFARELSMTEWNERRAEFGLSRIAWL
jgi:hypothetical protein